MIQEIEISKLENHPNNVRKTYTGIEELAESIKAQGILQNLTVVPKPGEKGRYLVVIGNRRLQAARMAGFKTVPCAITQMDEKEQMSVMLLENMQRTDLTYYEQAQGFQMMLDLGETEATIAEKTGFSRATVKHRLNIAKLDQSLLQKKEKDDSFQLSMKDFMELEKVESIETRNKILENAQSSRDLAWKAQNAAETEKKEKKVKKITDFLEARGIKKAPKAAENERYTNKWEELASFPLDEQLPEDFVADDSQGRPYWIAIYNAVNVIRRAQTADDDNGLEKLEKEKREANKKAANEKLRETVEQRREFLKKIISGEIEKIKNEQEIKDAIWNVLLINGTGVYYSTLRNFLVGKDDYKVTGEEREAAQEQAENLSIIHQMLIMMDGGMKSNEYNLIQYDGTYNEKNGKALIAGYEVLAEYGFSFTDPEQAKIIFGTSELYAQPKGDRR